MAIDYSYSQIRDYTYEPNRAKSAYSIKPNAWIS